MVRRGWLGIELVNRESRWKGIIVRPTQHIPSGYRGRPMQSETGCASEHRRHCSGMAQSPVVADTQGDATGPVVHLGTFERLLSLGQTETSWHLFRHNFIINISYEIRKISWANEL